MGLLLIATGVLGLLILTLLLLIIRILRRIVGALRLSKGSTTGRGRLLSHDLRRRWLFFIAKEFIIVVHIVGISCVGPRVCLSIISLLRRRLLLTLGHSGTISAISLIVGIGGVTSQRRCTTIGIHVIVLVRGIGCGGTGRTHHSRIHIDPQITGRLWLLLCLLLLLILGWHPSHTTGLLSGRTGRFALVENFNGRIRSFVGRPILLLLHGGRCGGHRTGCRRCGIHFLRSSFHTNIFRTGIRHFFNDFFKLFFFIVRDFFFHDFFDRFFFHINGTILRFGLLSFLGHDFRQSILIFALQRGGHLLLRTRRGSHIAGHGRTGRTALVGLRRWRLIGAGLCGRFRHGHHGIGHDLVGCLLG
mmetsp:Transcript_3407/g.7067  ORF Transcript_3407/g.7067 Transcript_3407/m.7067 type:complete len:360 (+) Transcript_3407:366-1445(+)